MEKSSSSGDFFDKIRIKITAGSLSLLKWHEIYFTIIFSFELKFTSYYKANIPFVC